MLHDFVFGAVGSAALPEDVAAAEGGDGVCVVDGVSLLLHMTHATDLSNLLTLADVAEPNVLKRAGTLAVDTLQLIGANDDVGDGRAVLQNEHGAVAAGVVIGVALTAAIEFLVAVVDRARDHGGLGEGDDRARASWDVEGLGGRKGRQRGEEGGGVEHFVQVLWVAGRSCWWLLLR